MKSLTEMRDEFVAKEVEGFDYIGAHTRAELILKTWNACLETLKQAGPEFDGHAVWYALGYDHKNEPAVEHIVNGARWQHEQMSAVIGALKAHNDANDRAISDMNRQIAALSEENAKAKEDWFKMNEQLQGLTLEPMFVAKSYQDELQAKDARLTQLEGLIGSQSDRIAELEADNARLCEALKISLDMSQGHAAERQRKVDAILQEAASWTAYQRTIKKDGQP